jgi:hypothetical protein
MAWRRRQAIWSSTLRVFVRMIGPCSGCSHLTRWSLAACSTVSLQKASDSAPSCAPGWIRKSAPAFSLTSAHGLGNWATSAGRDLADPAVRRDIENASLTWVFRALLCSTPRAPTIFPWITPAISRRRSRPWRNRLRTLWARSTRSRPARGTASACSYALCVLGDSAIGGPAYNGALFSANSLPGAPVLEPAGSGQHPGYLRQRSMGGLALLGRAQWPTGRGREGREGRRRWPLSWPAAVP